MNPASPGLIHDTGCLGLVHWDDPEGWYGKEEGGGSGWGTHVHPWWIHVNLWQSQYNIAKLKKKHISLLNTHTYSQIHTHTNWGK